MDPMVWRTVSNIVLLVGLAFGFIGAIGSWHFSNLAERVAPYRQQILHASATVEVYTESPEQVNDNYLDSGGLLAFISGNDAILVTYSTVSSARQQGNNEIQWRGVFQMDAHDLAIGKPVNMLGDTDYIQIEFAKMPDSAYITHGSAIVTVNNEVRLEIPIPEQAAQERRIIIRDLDGVFREFR